MNNLSRNHSIFLFGGSVLYWSSDIPACSRSCSKTISAVQHKEVGPHHRPQRLFIICLLHNGLQGLCPSLCCLCDMACARLASHGCSCSFLSGLFGSVFVRSAGWQARIILLASGPHYFWGNTLILWRFLSWQNFFCLWLQQNVNCQI